MRRLTLAEQAERLLSEATPQGECLITARTPSQDHPMAKVGGKFFKTYRIVWEHLIGPIPEGHELHHRCLNGRCLNVAHMEPVTDREHGKIHAPKQERCSVHGTPYDYRDSRDWGKCRACNREATRRYRGKLLA